MRPPTPWRRRAADALSQRLGLKAIALSLAIVLWFVVSAKEPNEERVPVRFEAGLDSSLALRDSVTAIEALVAGPSSELLKLAVRPLTIRRRIDADAPDTLAVDLTPKDVDIPDGVRVDVVDVQPRTIVLHFEATSTRRLPVRSAIGVTPAPPGAAFAVRFEPESVEVIGPRREVSRLAAVSTVRATVPPNDSVPHLVDLDTTRLDGVRVRPTQVRVHVVVTGVGAAPLDTTRRDSAPADSAPRGATGSAPRPAPRNAVADSLHRDSVRRDLGRLPMRPRRP